MEVLQDTYKDTKIGRIPKDWEIKQLASICDIVMGQSPSSESYNENDTGLPLVQGNADIKSRITKPRIYTSHITKISEVDDIIMTVRAPVGAIAKSNIKSCIGRGVCALRVKSIDNEFLYQMLIEKETSWIRLEQGSTFSAVNSKDIKTFKIALPPLPEQQKIAAILSTVDEQISTTDKIIEKSKELKKGLMQKLFSEGIGHTEFKDTKIGRIPKDWEVVKVGDICKLQGGFAFKSSDATENGVRWFKIANVGFNRVKWDAESFLPLGFEKKHPDFVLNEGDIVIAMTRPVLSGKLKICTIMKSDSGTLLNQRVGRVKLIDNNDNVYYYQSFNTKRFIDSVEGELFGTDPPNISSKLFESIKIPVPPKQERTKIAAILSVADAKIKKEQTQKAQLQALKKGLMQQLLTGKKRVKV
ncbi:restriction endonuclease subunit S [Flavobacteriaceae bacterium]|nr:restriction endonuclease subunit S [Flavobacteriaceae bacterium]